MSEEEKEFYGDEEHFLLEYDDEIEELKADIEEYRDSTTWWSNRFNAVERDNRKLRKEIERLNNIINEALEINKDIQEHLDKEFWIGRLELQEQILEGDKE